MSLIKNFLSYRFGNLILRIKIILLSLFYNSKKKKFFVIGVAEHGNYGDFAISEAQNLFLKDNFDADIVEITEEEISNPLTYKRIKAMLGPDDIIFLQGGGNHGNMYSFHEMYRREIIKTFRNNRIVLFPQTYYFSDDADGRKQAEISKEIYSSHPDLILAFRDRMSYSLANDVYTKNTVIFCPDMVLYLNGRFVKKNNPESDIMVLFRAGKEAKYQPEEKKAVTQKLSEKYKLTFNNHTTKEKVTKENRYSLVKSQVELYAGSDVVLTDKLHGAIFSIVTGTPCVMLSTFNHKLREFYKIFKNIDGYYFADTLEEIPDLIDKAFEIKNCTNPDLTEHYQNLIETIKRED
ncbi:MAG: polysaccharide pyruvyl transferase family protein [Clostridia bacterium]|nr:polysaccharide pyruvyl transferase family protein [Clostridia bacterium]